MRVVGYMIVTDHNTFIASDNNSGGYPCESQFGGYGGITSPEAKTIWDDEHSAVIYAKSCQDQYGPLTVKPLYLDI